MLRVYVLNRGPHDYEHAEQFGELVFCTEGLLDRDDTSQMYRELLEAMQDSQQDDYILLTSLTSLCSIACSIFTYKHGRLNLLIYKDGTYIQRTLVFNNTRIDNDPRITKRSSER